jgi:deoxyribodipyrimidine photo-lyase
MIDPSRLRYLNDDPIKSNRYVLYWMQQSQRTRLNHAFEYAIEQANELDQPFLVCFGLMDNYPEANERHYAFMIEGLRDVEAASRKRNIRFVVNHGDPSEVALHYAKHASLVVCDRGYLRHQRRWREQVAESAGCRVVQVESDVVVPVEAASDKAEFAARTLRPKIHRQWKRFLRPLREAKVRRSSLRLDVRGDIDVSDVDEALARLRIDRSVGRSTRFIGGQEAARAMLKRFISKKLGHYDERRNEPAGAGTSTMSPYLHFGQISPVEVALTVSAAKGASSADRDGYLEELIVRRELAVNFCYYQSDYDSYESLPAWR